MAKNNALTIDIQRDRERELVITRAFDAPRDLVFKAWTDPKHVAQWWGPKGFKNTILEMNVKPDGVWRFIMHGPDGTDYPNRITFKEVIKPERLAFDHGDDVDNDPNQFHVIVDFAEVGKKTVITFRMIFKSKKDRDHVVDQYGAIEGNKQTMDRLEVYLVEM